MRAITKLLSSTALIQSQPTRRRSLFLFLSTRGGRRIERSPGPTPEFESPTSVYDRCLQEATKLKTHIFMANHTRPTRFKLRVMKRVFRPPVHIPKRIAKRRGGTDVVSGKRVPFTKAMWEKQKRMYRKRHSLSTIHE
ncbi:hypothetical protein PsorP6_014979 [Peronosclerospora sorghi]|uniref:Uncharacterized protein n=1 Tax=Peronosclerospora sorghi TaxID=230839 RepID=A0ACC0VT96_9STRA|nr:hypothetical protein PsorP6_014979 [Peronosclerospora sorghi]